MTKIRFSDDFVCPKCGRHTALVCHADGTHQAHCMICDAYYDVDIEPITNADRIRAMTDEELLFFLWWFADGSGKTKDQWRDWLKQDAT